MKITNLFERMKPEVRQQFDLEEVKYPALASYMKTNLENNFFVKDIKYGVARDLQSLMSLTEGNAAKRFADISVYDMFEEMDFGAFHGQKGDNQ